MGNVTIPNWTILKLIEWTTEYFTKHEIPNPRLDTELLLVHTLNKKRIDLYLSFDYVVPEKELAVFKGYVQRRVKREPLQYIIGTQDFCGVQIKVTPDVLIPRPETEILVEECLNHLATLSSGHLTICDLCTGSGAIIAVLASSLPSAHFTGVDISATALDIARQNTTTWKGRVKLLCGNLFEPLPPHQFDVIVSNPPYIPESEWPTLQPEVRDYEPKEALLAGEDGLAIIYKIVNNAYKFLKPGGWLAMEVGNGQAAAVKKLLAAEGRYNEPRLIKDYGGIERIVWTSLL